MKHATTNDREIMDLCAKAMGWRQHGKSKNCYYNESQQTSMLKHLWNPLENDEQAMTIAKAFPHYALSAFSGMCGDIIDRGPMTGCGYRVNAHLCRLVASWQKLRTRHTPPVCNCRR